MKFTIAFITKLFQICSQLKYCSVYLCYPFKLSCISTTAVNFRPMYKMGEMRECRETDEMKDYIMYY